MSDFNPLEVVGSASETQLQKFSALWVYVMTGGRSTLKTTLRQMSSSSVYCLYCNM